MTRPCKCGLSSPSDCAGSRSVRWSGAHAFKTVFRRPRRRRAPAHHLYPAHLTRWIRPERYKGHGQPPCNAPVRLTAGSERGRERGFASPRISWRPAGVCGRARVTHLIRTRSYGGYLCDSVGFRVPGYARVGHTARRTDRRQACAHRNEAAKLAEEAYVFGYPLVLMDVTRNVSTAVSKPARPKGADQPVCPFPGISRRHVHRRGQPQRRHPLLHRLARPRRRSR